MLRKIAAPAAVCAGLTMAAAAAGHDARPLTARTPIGASGVGVVKYGMTLRQAEAATGQDFAPIGDGPVNSVCWTVRVKGVRGLSFMLKGSRIARASTGYPPARNPTTEGIRIGSSEAAVKRAYRGRIRVERHFYDPEGHYLVHEPVRRALRNRRIVFETDGRKVTGIRAGRLPEVGFVEGCS